MLLVSIYNDSPISETLTCQCTYSIKEVGIQSSLPGRNYTITITKNWICNVERNLLSMTNFQKLRRLLLTILKLKIVYIID